MLLHQMNVRLGLTTLKAGQIVDARGQVMKGIYSHKRITRYYNK